MIMQKGDYIQHPTIYPFKVPEFYGGLDESIQKNLFWVKIMEPHQPFEFAKKKNLHILPICWTNVPKMLAWKSGMPVETIELTQRTLLYQSIVNSFPVRPRFLQEYEQELIMTAQILRDLEKIPILIEEIKTGS